MRKEEINYGIVLGANLGRLEFAWPGKTTAMQNMKQQIIAEVKKELAMLDYEATYTTYSQLLKEVLVFIAKQDQALYAALLIGLCYARVQIANRSQKQYQDSFNNLALGALNGFPTNFISVEELYALIQKNQQLAITDFSSKIYELIFN